MNCVSTKICRRPAFRQLLIGMSIRRYLPPIGTAGFDRFRVSGNRRVPRPPPRMIASTSSIAIGGDLYQRSVRCALGRLVFAQRTYGATPPSRRREPGSWRGDGTWVGGRRRALSPPVEPCRRRAAVEAPHVTNVFLPVLEHVDEARAHLAGRPQGDGHGNGLPRRGPVAGAPRLMPRAMRILSAAIPRDSAVVGVSLARSGARDRFERRSAARENARATNAEIAVRTAANVRSRRNEGICRRARRVTCTGERCAMFGARPVLRPWPVGPSATFRPAPLRAPPHVEVRGK